ncbi:actin-regulating kinase prk1 [Salvia divinorum]|uniref:Actin-regulating kinase prk1 n=1 Tax=Salvia divinorum TaxID=28513 RepID=A0ABD1FM86_SALDI
MMVQHGVLWRATPILLFILLLFHNLATSHGESDSNVLLKFKASLENTAALANWTVSKPPCNGWKGVLCYRGNVWGLQLENMGLHGVIDVETLAKLPTLRSVSFKNNDFKGSLPNLTRHSALKTVFLSNNKFSGEIPDNAFYGMRSLKKLHLANNKFSGTIPTTLATVPRLVELALEDNEFEGEIPNFQQKGLIKFNVSNNRLAGRIPQGLSRLHASSFSGNKELCGEPLESCPANYEESWQRRFPETTIGVIAILVGAALITLLGVCIFLVCRKKRYQQQLGGSPELNQMERSTGIASPEGGKPSVRQLTFLKEETEKFDMQELLKSSAEILGSSVFGSTYKAGLKGKKMTVKRYKHMNQVSKEDFNEHMRRLGRINHHNVHPILAFYYKKEEKLFVADFVHNHSLAARLHGNQSLEWRTRLKIVKGVAKGLLYLHHELPSLTPAHGHLKASNVLLDSDFNPLLTDYGLIPILNKDHAEHNMVAYKSPEYKETAKLTKKTDVWCFGHLILEILTGRPSVIDQQPDADLATWLDTSGSGVSVFDQDMAATGNMMKLLKIGLSCCQANLKRRPEIKEVVEMVEEIKDKEFDDDFDSSYASERGMRSSRGLSQDFKPINL